MKLTPNGEKYRGPSEYRMTGIPKRSAIPSQFDFPVGWRWLGRFLIFVVTTRNWLRTYRPERKRLLILDRTIEIIRREQSKAQSLELVHQSRILNAGLYLLLIDRDLSVLKPMMVSSFDPWRLRFASRQIALILYEACDDLTCLFGKGFRDSLVAMEFKDSELERFNSISKRLNAFRNDNHQFFYHDIRNVVAAHRAHDSLKFLEAVEAIDPLRVFGLGGDFYEIVQLLISFLTSSLTYIGQPTLLLKQMLASPKFSRRPAPVALTPRAPSQPSS